MEKNKICWILMQDENPVAVCATEADVQELLMDYAMEARYENFCYSWLKNKCSMEICMKYNNSTDDYWYTKALDWR